MPVILKFQKRKKVNFENFGHAVFVNSTWEMFYNLL